MSEPRKNDAGWLGFDEKGRQQCLTCWKWQFPVIHSCPGIPQVGRKSPLRVERRMSIIETCREEHELDEDGNWRCGKTAELILWGKLFPTAALGPRCLDCARKYMPTDEHSISQWAVYDLRPVYKLQGESNVRS